MRKNSSKKHGVNSLLNRSQSAMEYLMTYGWAILIIAIVLVALFSLGIFNSANFAPRAQPGSCEVLRNSAQTSLVGQCNGMLPEYVANFDGNLNSGINKISDSNFPSASHPVSIFAWVKTSENANYPFVFNYGAFGTYEEEWILGIYSGQTCSDSYADHRCAGPLIDNGIWNFIGFTYANGTNTLVYVNGISYTGSGSSTPNIQVGSGTSARIGGGASGANFTGNIANIQIYNTSLSNSSIKTLYKEGIGGAPINVNNLVGWWPLNGNANDYSGNDNNGVPTNVIYTSAWTSGYSAP